jgi:hypothetical protein
MEGYKIPKESTQWRDTKSPRNPHNGEIQNPQGIHTMERYKIPKGSTQWGETTSTNDKRQTNNEVYAPNTHTLKF